MGRLMRFAVLLFQLQAMTRNYKIKFNKRSLLKLADVN